MYLKQKRNRILSLIQKIGCFKYDTKTAISETVYCEDDYIGDKRTFFKLMILKNGRHKPHCFLIYLKNKYFKNN